MSKIRVLIIDDHPLLRMGIRGLIEGRPDLEVAADCADLTSARTWLQTECADVAIIDRNLPDGDGLELLPILKAQGTRTIILTVEDDDVEIRSAVEAGVDGYLLKSSDSDQILMAISMVLKDSVAFPAHILQKMSNGQVDTPLTRLSVREIEIAESVAEGLSNKVIGARLHLSDNTVRNHLANIMQKLGLSNRVQVATLMLQHARRKKTPPRE